MAAIIQTLIGILMACFGAYLSSTGIRAILSDTGEQLKEQHVIRNREAHDPQYPSLFQAPSANRK